MKLDIFKNDRSRSITFMILVAILWSIGGILIKLIQWNSLAIVGSKSLIAALTMLIYLRKPKLALSKPKLLGALFYAANVILIVVANKLTTAANVVLLRFTSPVFVAILGFWILKEKIHWYDLLAILGVFGGMSLFFIDNIDGGNMLGNIFAVMAGFFFAAVTISFRFQKNGSPMETAFLGNLVAFVITIPFMFQTMPNIMSMVCIVLLGVVQLGTSYILYSLAIIHLSAIEAVLITVLEPILNPIWVLLIIGEKPSFNAIIGGIIVIVVVTLRGIYVNRYVNIETKL